MAGLWRAHAVRGRVVAVTGSVGKTTAKELIAAMLRTQSRTHMSLGSVNSSEWLARAMLGIRPKHRFAVLEVSAGGYPGQMREVAPFVRPDVAVIVALARTHTTVFTSLDGAAEEKAYLLDSLSPGGVAVLNGDDSRVAALATRARAKGHRVVSFGTTPGFDFRGLDATARWPERLSFTLEHEGRQMAVVTQLVGTHWLPSVLAALATAVTCGVRVEEAIEAVRYVAPSPSRLQPVQLPGGAVMLRDDFNGSVDTLERALDVLRTARVDRRVLMITDFTDFRANFHHRYRHLARLVPGTADHVVFIGEHAGYAERRLLEVGFPAAAITVAEDLREAAHFATEHLREGDLALIRGQMIHHVSRIFLDQVGEVRCWKSTCTLRKTCDRCPNLTSPS